MRYDYSKAAIAAALTLAPTSLIAAPNSMLNTLPRAEQSQASQPSKMGWLTKWFRGEQAQQPAIVAPPAGNYPPVMAYQPPQATVSPAQTGPLPSIASVEPASTPLTAPTFAAAAQAPQATTPVLPEPGADLAAQTKQLREQGHALDRTGDLAAAERIYRQAIGTNPASAASVNDLGLCLARQGKLQDSAAVLRQAIAMRPDKPLYRNNLATVLVELDQPAEALAHLKTACRPAAAHFNLGQLLVRSGKIEEATTELQEALRLEPSLTPARQALAGLTPETTLANTAPAAEPITPIVAAQPQPAATPTPAVAPQPQAMPPSYEMQVAAAPSAVVAPTPAPAAPTTPAAAGVPSFPRLLPPVLNP